MTTFCCHWLIMGKKWKLAFTAVSLQIFWQKFYRNLPWVVLYKTYLFCCNHLIWLVTRATKRQNLRKNISSEAVWGIKLKLCRIVSNNSLYKKIVFLLPLLKLFGCYGNLKFPLTYSGKNENWDLLLSHCRYFHKSFAEMFVEWSSTKYIILDQTSQFDWLPWQPKCLNLRKKIKKSTLQKL